MVMVMMMLVVMWWWWCGGDGDGDHANVSHCLLYGQSLISLTNDVVETISLQEKKMYTTKNDHWPNGYHRHLVISIDDIGNCWKEGWWIDDRFHVLKMLFPFRKRRHAVCVQSMRKPDLFGVQPLFFALLYQTCFHIFTRHFLHVLAFHFLHMMYLRPRHNGDWIGVNFCHTCCFYPERFSRVVNI